MPVDSGRVDAAAAALTDVDPLAGRPTSKPSLRGVPAAVVGKHHPTVTVTVLPITYRFACPPQTRGGRRRAQLCRRAWDMARERSGDLAAAPSTRSACRSASAETDHSGRGSRPRLLIRDRPQWVVRPPSPPAGESFALRPAQGGARRVTVRQQPIAYRPFMGRASPHRYDRYASETVSSGRRRDGQLTLLMESSP